MSLYADYMKEIHGKHIIENERGFIMFSKQKDHFYIEDIYVIPDFRRSRAAVEMADWVCAIAKDAKINRIIGSVVPSSKTCDISLRMMLAYGMSLHSSQNNIIFFVKDI